MRARRKEYSGLSVAETLPGGIVLIVSSDREFLNHYREFLLEWGFTPLTATTTLAALACLRLVVVTLVVLDQRVGTFEGETILDRAQQLKALPSVIVVNRAEDSNLCREVHALGAVEYLEDPVTIPDILRVLAANPTAPSEVA